MLLYSCSMWFSIVLLQYNMQGLPWKRHHLDGSICWSKTSVSRFWEPGDDITVDNESLRALDCGTLFSFLLFLQTVNLCLFLHLWISAPLSCFCNTQSCYWAVGNRQLPITIINCFCLVPLTCPAFYWSCSSFEMCSWHQIKNDILHEIVNVFYILLWIKIRGCEICNYCIVGFLGFFLHFTQDPNFCGIGVYWIEVKWKQKITCQSGK